MNAIQLVGMSSHSPQDVQRASVPIRLEHGDIEHVEAADEEALITRLARQRMSNAPVAVTVGSNGMGGARRDLWI